MSRFVSRSEREEPEMQLSAKAAAARASRGIGLLSCVTALSCGGHTDGGAASAPLQGGKSDSGSGGSTISLGSGGSTGSGGHTGAGGIRAGAGGGAAVDASVQVPLDAGPQPIVSCGAGSDAGILDGAACAPPPSHCVDQHTLAYYTGGRCMDGLCSWTTEFLTCPTACYGEGCRNNITVSR